jgi:hypothetical protein
VWFVRSVGKILFRSVDIHGDVNKEFITQNKITLLKMLQSKRLSRIRPTSLYQVVQ